MDEPKPECLPGVLIDTDNITKIVNKRFMKTQRDDFVATGKDAMTSSSNTQEVRQSNTSSCVTTVDLVDCI